MARDQDTSLDTFLEAYKECSCSSFWRPDALALGRLATSVYFRDVFRRRRSAKGCPEPARIQPTSHRQAQADESTSSNVTF